LGLDDSLRLNRTLPDAVVVVHPLSAHDFHLRGPGIDRGAKRGPTVNARILRQIDVAEAPGQPLTGVEGDQERALYGVMAEFADHEQVLEAAKSAYAEGYRQMDAYSPFAVEGLAEAL